MMEELVPAGGLLLEAELSPPPPPPQPDRIRESKENRNEYVIHRSIFSSHGDEGLRFISILLLSGAVGHDACHMGNPEG
jgi:hypothetical protein